jgi:hypothetical protein
MGLWCQYLQKRGGTCTCNDAFSHFNCTTDKTQAVRCTAGAVEIRTCQDPCVVQPIGVDDTCDPALNPPDLGTSDGAVPEVDAATPSAADMSEAPMKHDGCDCDLGGRRGAPPSAAPILLLLFALVVRRVAQRART